MDDFLDQFPPTNINSSTIINLLNGIKLSEEELAITQFFPSVLTMSLIEKNGKFYLIFVDEGNFTYSIEILKQIILHLQKTVKAITNKDLINLQKQYREKQQSNNFEKRQSPIEKQTTKGKIYILKSIDYLHYKIGKTMNINRRLIQIQPALPFKTKLIHTIFSNNINKAELFLHEKFKDKRTNGEWFDLSKEDVKLLKRTSTINV
jgi:hypothetical protein